jgi:hypothetical protein
MISVDDIAFFVVHALLNPTDWLGRRQEVAGDRLCAEDMAATLARLRGGTEKWKVSVPPDFVFKWFIPKAVGSLKQFLETKGTHVRGRSGGQGGTGRSGRCVRMGAHPLSCCARCCCLAPPTLLACSQVDIDACRKIHPGLMTFEAWAVARGYATKKFDAPGLCSVQ